VLTPEYADAGHRPRFWLGLPQSIPQELAISSEKGILRDNKKYLELATNYFPQVRELDFMVYQTTGYETLHLGQAVTYHGRQLVVIHIDSRLERELLTHTFLLAQAESIALKGPGENTNLKGCALPGKVLERSGVHVKIHLDIDENQDKATAIWFPYSADADSFMYCMPHEGETINLYFRNGWEAEALAISGARKNGQGCAKTGDYNHRYFTNHERKEMYLSPDTLSFTADESAPVKIAIVMTDANGIDIVSAKDIVFAAENDIKLKGKTITMEAGAAGSEAPTGATTPGLYLNTGLASIVMKDDINNFYGKPVKTKGTNKAPCPQPEEVPLSEAEEDEENQMTAEDWTELGLAIAGFIPSPTISTAAAIGEAGLALKQGDYFGAGVSLLGGVPFVGGFVRVAKIAKKGKIAKKIFKVLNAGKNVTKLKGRRMRLPLGKMKTKGKHVQVDTGKAIKNAAEASAKKSGKTETLAKNRESGRAFEKKSLGKMKENNENVVEQITVKTQSGIKTRLDGVGVDKKTGEIVIEEYKASSTAPLTKNQKIAHPEIAGSGATVVGKGKEPFVGGIEIPPTKIKIIRKD